ncbi:hypothetical protein BOTBODRAFT_114606 [Botryobasidium botryosum FD-172 SS1]|uniref:NADH:flavin oxidoreductase/NADH oxidase N-terminal domain-containing protein n=1 Tax=Botryobasidium botryosum (strain FD-172 SS1) TaxID=930990 RepID=A0A067MHL3_BOTB1|nr:hypothetical protein BOTBODRAFT_114606 [Botryobasidium botryosum FD-172 SS1]
MSSGDLLSASGSDDATLLASPVRLPCGRTVPSRLVKAAMYEGLATFPGGPPNESHFNLYTAWARGGWGMIITGNVQVSAEHLTLGRDMIVPEKITTETIAPFRLLADAMHSSASPQTAALALMQLSHSGRQSPRIIGGRSFWLPPLAPSPVKMSSSGEGLLSRLFYAALFPTPREMSDHDIEHIIERFVEGAKVALDAGFDGIQLHSAHGYFLAQILSPKTNLRQPPYGYPNELNVLKKIVKRIRSFAPPAFVIGIKLNAADYASGGLSDQHALEHVKTIAGWAGERAGVDFIEISGGDYEQPSKFVSFAAEMRMNQNVGFAICIALESLCNSSVAATSAILSILQNGRCRSSPFTRSTLSDAHWITST